VKAFKEQKNKFGVQTKSLFYRHLELEYWQLIEEIKAKHEKKTDADAIRFALKKATGRI
jgi:hypothetical protein